MSSNCKSFIDDSNVSKVNFDVTRIDWCVHTSLLDLNKDIDVLTNNDNSKESLLERCSTGINYHNDNFGQYDSGLCCITKVESIKDSTSDSTGIEGNGDVEPRCFQPVSKKIQCDGHLLFSNFDRFIDRFYYNIKDETDVIDLGEDYQNRGVGSVPEDVLFYYLNLPFLWKKIQSMKNLKCKKLHFEFDSRGTITKDIKVTISFGPVKWVEYPKKFRFKRFVITLTYNKISDSKVGCTLNVEDDKGLETEIVNEHYLEERQKLYDEINDNYNRMMEDYNSRFNDFDDQFTKC